MIDEMLTEKIFLMDEEEEDDVAEVVEGEEEVADEELGPDGVEKPDPFAPDASEEA